MRIALLSLAVAFAACGGEAPVASGPAGPTGGTAAAMVGQVAILMTREHGVRGRATITSATTIHLEGFSYDNGALSDVRFYGGKAGAYYKGFSFGPQLAGKVWTDEALDLTLPEGKSIADLDGLSVWCVIAGVSLGDGQFHAP